VQILVSSIGYDMAVTYITYKTYKLTSMLNSISNWFIYKIDSPLCHGCMLELRLYQNNL